LKLEDNLVGPKEEPYDKLLTMEALSKFCWKRMPEFGEVIEND